MSEMEPVKFAEHLLISEVTSRWLPKKVDETLIKKEVVYSSV